MKDRTHEASETLGRAVTDFVLVLAEALRPPPPPPPEPPSVPVDRLLRPERAAETLGVSRQYFYDHEAKLPFVVRLSNGVLRVSEDGMHEWIEARKGGQR